MFRIFFLEEIKPPKHKSMFLVITTPTLCTLFLPVPCNNNRITLLSSVLPKMISYAHKIPSVNFFNQILDYHYSSELKCDYCKWLPCFSGQSRECLKFYSNGVKTRVDAKAAVERRQNSCRCSVNITNKNYDGAV